MPFEDVDEPIVMPKKMGLKHVSSQKSILEKLAENKTWQTCTECAKLYAKGDCGFGEIIFLPLNVPLLLYLGIIPFSYIAVPDCIRSDIVFTSHIRAFFILHKKDVKRIYVLMAFILIMTHFFITNI